MWPGEAVARWHSIPACGLGRGAACCARNRCTSWPQLLSGLGDASLHTLVPCSVALLQPCADARVQRGPPELLAVPGSCGVPAG